MNRCMEKGKLITSYANYIYYSFSLIYIFWSFSWHLLNETIDELLKVNPKCVVISSMERRTADGIDLFLEEMRNMEHVGDVEKVWYEEGRKIEIYVTVTRGIQ